MTPDQIRARIAADLSVSHPGEDVRVDIGPVPYGNFVWNEKGGIHTPMATAELAKVLGAPEDVRSWIRSLPLVKFDVSLLKSNPN
jgi:hypothetical protein